MRAILFGAVVLLSGPAFAMEPGIPAAPLVKLIKARHYKCAEPAQVMREISDRSGLVFTVYCKQAPPHCSGEDVFRVTRHVGGRISVERYIDPFSGKAVSLTCPY